MYELCATARRRRAMGCAAARVIARPHPAPPAAPVVIGDASQRADGALTLSDADWHAFLSDSVVPF